jgi:cobalt-zinc-cadmium resistance protein CzcA
MCIRLAVVSTMTLPTTSSTGSITGIGYFTYQRPRKTFHNPVLTFLADRYQRAIRYLTVHPMHAIVPGAIAAVLAVVLWLTIGKEFLPYLDEGSIWLQVQLPPGLSLEKAASMANELRAATLEFPEVTTIVTQLGRNDDGTDPWTPSHIECSVGLKPYSTWPNCETKQDLIKKLGDRYARVPGITVGFSQPMIDGVNDKIINSLNWGSVEQTASQRRPWARAVVGALSRTRRAEGADKNDLRRGSSVMKEFAMARICASALARLLSAAASFFACR